MMSPKVRTRYFQPGVAASFNNSRAFSRVIKENKGEEGMEPGVPKAPEAPIEIVATYAKDNLLMSGWASEIKNTSEERPR